MSPETMARDLAALKPLLHFHRIHIIGGEPLLHPKLERFFGPQPKTPLPEGLHRMAQWVKAVGTREPVRFKDIEVTRNLPPSWR